MYERKSTYLQHNFFTSKKFHYKNRFFTSVVQIIWESDRRELDISKHFLTDVNFLKYLSQSKKEASVTKNKILIDGQKPAHQM